MRGHRLLVTGQPVKRRRLRAPVAFLTLALCCAGVGLGLPAAADTTAVTVELLERSDSNVSGNAMLEAVDGVTWITIAVSGPQTDYLPSLHGGTCDEFRDAPAVPLSLASPPNPTATAVDIPLDDLIGGNYVIDLHALGESIEELLDPSTSVACGVIGAAGDDEPPAGDEVNPPVAGIRPIDSSRDWMLLGAAALCLVSLVLTVTSIRRPSSLQGAAGASFSHGGGVLR